MEKVIVFDFDGVLYNSKKIAYKMHNKIAKDFNLQLIKNKKQYFNVLDNSHYYRTLEEDIKKQYNLNHRNLMYDNAEKSKLYSGVEKIFEIPNCKFAIVSSTYEKTINKVLDIHKLSTDIFYRINGNETVGSKTTKVEQIIADLKVDKKDVIYVGDTYSDIMFCEKLGIRIIVSDYGYSNTKPIVCKNIIGRVKSVRQLVTFLNNI